MYSRVLKGFHQKIPGCLADVRCRTDDVKAVVSAFIDSKVDRNTCSS